MAHVAELRDMATALCVAYDPATGRMRIASAGHVPPIVVSPGGEARALDGVPSLPLNVDPSVVFVESEETLEPGCTLLLYTDGLIERRGETVSVGLRDLEAAVARAPTGAEALCTHLAEHALDDRARPDDVALLALRSLPLRGRALELRLPARPETLADIRRSLERWLGEHGASTDEVYSFLLATGEACGNAIEHAYGPADAELEIDAVLEAGTVSVSVRDFGRWRAQRGEGRGRGLFLMRELMDDVSVTPSDEGTTVKLSLRLADPADAHSARTEVAGRSRAVPQPVRNAIANRIQGDAEVHVSREDELVIATLAGEIDMANAEAAFGRVAAALDNRALAVILDLSATRYLDSSGLQAMLDLLQRTRVRGQEMCVVALPDSPPRRLIEVAGAEDKLPLHTEVAAARAALRRA
jgi:anti-anti-sigma factor